MGNRDFVKYYLREALHGALTEANGDENLSRHANAEIRLRLISMPDE